MFAAHGRAHRLLNWTAIGLYVTFEASGHRVVVDAARGSEMFDSEDKLQAAKAMLQHENGQTEHAQPTLQPGHIKNANQLVARPKDWLSMLEAVRRQSFQKVMVPPSTSQDLQGHEGAKAANPNAPLTHWQEVEATIPGMLLDPWLRTLFFIVVCIILWVLRYWATLPNKAPPSQPCASPSARKGGHGSSTFTSKLSCTRRSAIPGGGRQAPGIEPGSVADPCWSPGLSCQSLEVLVSKPWFVISDDALGKWKSQRSDAPLPVLGFGGGRPLMYATFESAANESTMFLSQVLGPEGSPLAALRAPMPVCGRPVHALRVQGQGGALFGWLLRLEDKSGFALRRRGRELLSVRREDRQLCLAAPSAGTSTGACSSGKLGLASWCGDAEGHLEVRVDAGVDAVLVLCCVLAEVLFGGGPYERDERTDEPAPRQDVSGAVQ